MLISELQTYSLTHKTCGPFSSSSSGDNTFSFITEKGIDVLELAPDPNGVSPSLSCRRYFIKSSPELPTANLGIDPNDLLPHLERKDAYALISDISMSTVLNKMVTPTPAPKQSCWSPVGILANSRCILAVMTDAGSLTLYVLLNNEYTMKARISKLWLQQCKKSWQEPPKSSTQKLKELKQRAERVKLTTMCWLDDVQEGKGCLATSSKSGMIVLWQVISKDATTHDLEVTLMTHFDSNYHKLTMLHWTVFSSEMTLLTSASLDGKVSCFSLTSNKVGPMVIPEQLEDNPTPSVVSTHEIWKEQDRIATTHIASWSWKGGLVLIIIKGAFVITFYLNDRVGPLTYAAYRCCDISVNGLSRVSEDELMIVTRSSRFTRLALALTTDGKLELKTESVESYINIVHMGCYGLNMSRNGVICFILLSVNQSYDHLVLREPSQVVVCSVSGITEPQTILQDPQRPISQLWDCLELLRVQILRRVVVTDLTYPRSVLDTMTIDQLTTALWWITFASVVEEDEDKYKLLQSLRCEVETLVISCHFFRRIALLLSSLSDLTSFQLQSLGVIYKWLVTLQGLPEEYTTTLITGKTLSEQLSALGERLPLEELCTICGSVVAEVKNVHYSECPNNHSLPRCSLSLVQCVQLPYFICSQCGVLALSQAVTECGTTCNFCGGVLRNDEEIINAKD